MEQPAPLPPLPDDVAIRHTASEILRGPDYILSPQGHEQEAFLFKLLEAIKRIFKGMTGWAEELYIISPLLYFLLMAGLFLILVALLWHITYSLRQAFSRADDATLATKEAEQSDEPAMWERRANEALGRGDRVYALRCLLMAGLLRLEAGQKKRLRRGATNREILRRYRDSAAFEPLKLMVDLVDVKWYGGAVCEPADYDAGADAYAKLRSAANAAAAAAAAKEGRARA